MPAQGPPAVPPAATVPAPAPTPSPPGEPPTPTPLREQTPAAANDIVVTGRSRRGDPLEGVNTQSYAATEAADRAVIGPAARAYARSIPRPVRKGLRNFLFNLGEPINFVNFVLQLKPGKAGATLGRFALNSTVGIAGLIDVAKRRPFRLPKRRNGFANTLGYYGVGPGPFFFLPLLGPTTARDLLGTVVDGATLPLTGVTPIRRPEYLLPITVLNAFDRRADFEGEITRQRASSDPYAAARGTYLRQRQADIDALRGRRPAIISPITDPPPPVVPR